MSESAKSGSSSPVKTPKKAVNFSNVSKQAKSPILNSSQKNNKTYAALAKKSANTKSTISFDRPTTARNDISIYHENKITLTLVASNRNSPTKRDPILQDNDEAVKTFRPSLRPVSAERTSARKEDPVRAKKKGDFNHHYNPRPQEAKPQGIKAFMVAPPQSRDENPRRISKDVRYNSEIRQRNPLHGDSSVERARGKKPVENMDDHQKLNEKKYLLPSERGSSPQGRVFRESTINLGEMNFSSLGSQTERQIIRPLSASELKVRGSIKGVLEYEGGPTYRDQVVADKCQTIRFADIVNAQDNTSRVFARKKTLEYQ